MQSHLLGAGQLQGNFAGESGFLGRFDQYRIAGPPVYFRCDAKAFSLRIDRRLDALRQLGADVAVQRTHAEFQRRALRDHVVGLTLVDKKTVTASDASRFHAASTPLSDEVARQLVDQYGSQANPSEMVTLRCDDVASLVNTVAQSDAIFLGVIAANQSGLKDDSLVELHLKPKLVASARFAYVTLAGRTEAPAMAYFRGFIRDQLRD